MKKYTYSEGGNPLTIFVNLHQSSGERRYKYRLIRALGHSASEAKRWRDWRYASLERRHGITLVRFEDD